MPPVGWGVNTAGEPHGEVRSREKHQTSTQEASYTGGEPALKSRACASACSLTAPFPYHPEELRDGGYMARGPRVKRPEFQPSGPPPTDSLLLLSAKRGPRTAPAPTALKTLRRPALGTETPRPQDLHCEDHSPRVPVPLRKAHASAPRQGASRAMCMAG